MTRDVEPSVGVRGERLGAAEPAAVQIGRAAGIDRSARIATAHALLVVERRGRHERVHVVVVRDDGEPVGRLQSVEHELGAALRLVERLARHRARAVDHERQVQWLRFGSSAGAWGRWMRTSTSSSLS